MLTQLERTVLAYTEARTETDDPPSAMRRAAARVRAIDAERERRQDARRAELSLLSDEQLVARAKTHSLPITLWRAGLIEEIANHEIRTELCVELLGDDESGVLAASGADDDHAEGTSR